MTVIRFVLPTLRHMLIFKRLACCARAILPCFWVFMQVSRFGMIVTVGCS